MGSGDGSTGGTRAGQWGDARPANPRGVGGFCAVVGLLGVMQERTWAPTLAALGVLAWFAGHWSFAVRNEARYRSRLARALIDKTPLEWTIPGYWQLRREQRLAPGR